MTLTLLGRAYCHLCDDMLAELALLRAVLRFELESVDVDADPELERRYGEKVPMLFFGRISDDREICHYFLDAARLTASFEAVGPIR